MSETVAGVEKRLILRVSPQTVPKRPTGFPAEKLTISQTGDKLPTGATAANCEPRIVPTQAISSMGVTYFKRFRMEIPLQAATFHSPRLPDEYQLIRWDLSLIPHHADAKYRSFCAEIDANVFPCLGDPAGCLRLMEEISDKRGFLPEATWLVIHRDPHEGTVESCGTVQGIGDYDRSCGSIQNLGVTPEHRGTGIGSFLLLKALDGFRRNRLQRASLEVTAQNTDAVRLYRKLGFRRVKTVYKAVEVAYS